MADFSNADIQKSMEMLGTASDQLHVSCAPDPALCDEVLRPSSRSNLVPTSTEAQALALYQAAVVTSQPGRCWVYMQADQEGLRGLPRLEWLDSK